MSYIAGAEYAAGMMGAWSRSGIGKKREEEAVKQPDFMELWKAGRRDQPGTESNREDYLAYLKLRFGNVMIQDVGKDQRSMDRLGAGTDGTGNVVIAPEILEQMAEDPRKAAYYEGKIQDYYDSLPRMKAQLSMMGHEIHSSGVVIHKDGTVTYYVSGDLKPEVRARIEARMKEEAEAKAKRRKYFMKLSEEADQRRRELVQYQQKIQEGAM